MESVHSREWNGTWLQTLWCEGEIVGYVSCLPDKKKDISCPGAFILHLTWGLVRNVKRYHEMDSK